MYRLSLLLLFVFLAGCTQTAEQKGLVVGVVDGDTIKVLTTNETMTIRLLGMDTPEIHGRIDCYGPEAANYTNNNLLGKEITLYSDHKQGNKDRYGRYLRYVYLNNVDFNAQLVREGYARAYTKIDSDRLPEYLALQSNAIQNHRGLWAAC